jgi:3-(3-hydroxy-phenyl)propionate hydroxylase
MPNGCEVLIAGAGPAGLTAGLALADAGVRVTLFDATAAIEEDLRATTFHPPTLDLLERFGITHDLLEHGLVCPSWQMRSHPDGERVVFDLSVLADETRHPYRLQCEQWRLSRALLKRLAAIPHASVRFATRVVGLTHDAQGVDLVVESHGRQETLRGHYLIGADGARSSVRRLLGLVVDGDAGPETTMLATTRFAFDAHLEGLSHVNHCWQRGGNFSLLKIPGRWRVAIHAPHSGADHNAPPESAIDEALQAALQKIVPRDKPYKVSELRPYRVQQGIVERYRVGRVFLAGDAAHVNSAIGGMGLNGGVHDALNLASKLTAVARGKSDAALLDLYERQRRPVAREQMRAEADNKRAHMRETDPAKQRAIMKDLRALAADRDRLRAHLLRTSMITGLRQAAEVV